MLNNYCKQHILQCVLLDMCNAIACVGDKIINLSAHGNNSPNRDRPLSKGFVDNLRQMVLKKLHNVKNSYEWSKFLGFYLYLCHAVLMNC